MERVIVRQDTRDGHRWTIRSTWTNLLGWRRSRLGWKDNEGDWEVEFFSYRHDVEQRLGMLALRDRRYEDYGNPWVLDP